MKRPMIAAVAALFAAVSVTACTTVETTIRIVSRWLKDRIVVEEGGHLVLRDVDALRGLTEGDEG